MENLMGDLMVLIKDIETNILSRRKHEDVESEIELKGLENYVTSYDSKIENYLKTKLTKLIPGSTFIGEESGVFEGSNGTYTWIVDPIDGTTNFIHQLPYTISIALVKNSTTELGLVYNVVARELYTAVKGKGSYLNGKPIEATKRDKIYDSLFAYGYPFESSKIRMTIEKALAVKEKGAADIKRMGPSSLDLCKVARGQLEGYFEYDLEPWDVAAGIIILEEAKGNILKMNGMPYDYKRCGIIATNQSEKLQKALFKIVGDPLVLKIDMER